MNLLKFKLVTSDEFVINSAIVLDASRLAECVVTGATMVVTFDVGETNSILTWTFDGTDAAEKLLNATKAQTELLNMVSIATDHNQKGVLDFFPGTETIDQWGDRLSIIHTGGTAGTGLVSIVLS
tara:strand:+ start:249 stop:623 length:375 start_codon:yes stop_codon:yes gene_type:complete